MKVTAAIPARRIAPSHISQGLEQRISPDFPHLITSISSPGLANLRTFISACIELVTDHRAKTPASELAKSVVEECFRRGLLVLGPDGFYRNVIVLAPPLSINEERLTEGMTIVRQSLARVSRP